MTTSHGDVYTFVYIFIYMGKELDSDFYNEVFKNGGSEGMYFLSYDQTPWVNVWNEIIDYIIGAVEFIIINYKNYKEHYTYDKIKNIYYYKEN